MTPADLLPVLLRPQALWLLLLLPLAWWWRPRRSGQGGWEQVVDRHLLPAQLAPGRPVPRWRRACPLLAAALAILVLAGPSWGRHEARVARTQGPLVVAVELSDALQATDLVPSRLLRLRDKLGQLLARRADGALALVVYAGDAYTVVPLTDDVANVALFVDALAPEVMPTPGTALDRALDLSGTLLAAAPGARGQVLVLATTADAAAVEAAARLRHAGATVSVIGIGPAAGWAMGALSRVAAGGGGRFAVTTGDGTDLETVGVLARAAAGEGASGRQLQRRDDGPWLLPLVLALLLPALRAGAGLLALLLGLGLLLPPPVQAAGDWWRRPDQQAHARLAEGVRAYRRGDFPAAEAAFRGQETAVGQYNLGNALARQGRLREAVAAYDRALARQPDMADARANRAAVLAALARKPPDGGQSPQEGSSPQDAPPARPAGPGVTPEPDAPASPPRGRPHPGAAPGQAPGSPGRPDPSGDRQGPSSPGDARRQLDEAWLQQVPDEPGLLLRRMLQMEHARRQWQR